MADPRIDRQQRILSRLAVRSSRRAFVVQEPRAFAERLRIVARACTIVARAHAAGIVHRDLRPAMIVVDELGDAEVIGWETASLVDEHDDEHVPTLIGAATALAFGFVQRERYDRYRVYLQLWMAKHADRS